MGVAVSVAVVVVVAHFFRVDTWVVVVVAWFVVAEAERLRLAVVVVDVVDVRAT